MIIQGTFELPILKPLSKLSFSFKNARSLSFYLEEKRSDETSTLTIQNLVFIPLENIIIPNQ